MSSSTDRIEKQVVLKAPLERVWHAVSDARAFGSWFGVRFDGPFAPGAHLTGRITPTTVDPEVARGQVAYEGHPFEVTIDRMEPMRLFSFRWHPYAMDPAVDYSKEPTTLVEFVLEEVDGGVRLSITESGFDAIPVERRAEAFKANEGGWTAQLTLVGKYLARDA